MSSWHINPPDQPCPPVAFEISSKETWSSDVTLDKKPAIYGRIGFKEYFAYDPNVPQVWRGLNNRRLIGWRFENSQPVEIEPDEQGRIFSVELDSWLVPDELYLRLYDRDGQLRLTGAEAAEQARLQAEEVARQEAQRREQAERRAAELERLLDELRNQNKQKGQSQ